MNQTARHVAAFGLLMTLPGLAGAQNFTHSLPASVPVGKTTLVTCYGSGLAKAQTLWTTFPATVALAPGAKQADNAVVFQVTTAADAPVGMHGIRVITDSGISDPRLFVVDDLPVVLKTPPNQTIEQAQKLPLPVAVDGIMGGEQRDFYAITVAAGQRLAFEVVGNRYGVDFDPLLVIWSPAKKEIAIHDNDEGLGFDARFEHVFKEAGEHIIEIRDTRYQGGGNWTYHLRIGDFPIARVAFPPGGQRGRWVSIAFPGRNATDVAPMNVQLPESSLVDMLTVVPKGNNASAWTPFVIDDQVQQLELEPNNEQAQANAFEISRTLNGRLQEKGDADCYRFDAKAGQQVTFQADTRRLSSPADLYLRIMNAQGQQVMVVDDTGAEDGILNFKAPADGTFTLVVEDLNRRGGPEYIYRIESFVSRADFKIEPTSDRLVIGRGSFAPMLVNTGRTGYGGPIELSVAGGAGKPTLAGGSVPAGAANATVTLSAPFDLPLGPQTIRIVGTATIGDRQIAHAGDLLAVLAPKLGNSKLLPPDVVQEIPVLITPKPFFSLSAQLGAPAVARFVKTPVTITATKEKFFDDAITLAVENLPPTIAVAVKPIPKGEKSVQLEIESKPQSPLGRIPIFISGTATHAGTSARVFADMLYIDLQPAFSLTVSEPETKIARSGKVKVTVKAARLPGYDGPIDVTLKNLPKGITAPPAKIAEKQLEVAIELTAAADAPPATVANLSATGTATIGGQPETATSGNVKLVVAEK